MPWKWSWTATASWRNETNAPRTAITWLVKRNGRRGMPRFGGNCVASVVCVCERDECKVFRHVGKKGRVACILKVRKVVCDEKCLEVPVMEQRLRENSKISTCTRGEQRTKGSSVFFSNFRTWSSKSKSWYKVYLLWCKNSSRFKANKMNWSRLETRSGKIMCRLFSQNLFFLIVIVVRQRGLWRISLFLLLVKLG
jgi:hypothetical protein